MAEHTKSRLLQAGEQLFVREGYVKTTVGDIERAAGLSARAGGFYRHFKSKEALLLALAESRFETREQLGLTDLFPLSDTRAELIYIARAYDRLNQGHDGLSQMLRVEAARVPALKTMIVEANERLFRSLCAYLSEKPALKDQDDTAMAEAAIMVFGGWLFFLTRRDEVPAPTTARLDGLLERWADFWSAVLDGKANIELGPHGTAKAATTSSS